MKRIYALYLPQYHEIRENNEWWGKGYTEWNAVKRAAPLFKGHCQPKIPLNNNYYDLSDETGSVWEWQASLANQYGIEGFCIYHYWFKNCRKLLEKPMEILLSHKEINIKFFICWANEPWKRTWYQNNGTVLVEQDYGDAGEWKKHYEYLRQFFMDDRYLKINGKPVIAIYKTLDIVDLSLMKELWNKLANNDGFEGVYILGAKTAFEQETRMKIVDGEYLFEPAYTMHYQFNVFDNIVRLFSKVGRTLINYFKKEKLITNVVNMKTVYKRIKRPKKLISSDIFCGLCPSWDNTPRKQNKGTFFKNASPELFEKALKKFYSDKSFGDILMINAWNEWGEGAFLEPSEDLKYGYLEAIKNATSKE